MRPFHTYCPNTAGWAWSIPGEIPGKGHGLCFESVSFASLKTPKTPKSLLTPRKWSMCSKKRVSKDLSHLASLDQFADSFCWLWTVLCQETIRLRADAKLLEGGAVEAIDSSKERRVCVVHTSGHIFLRWQETDPMMSEDSQSHQKKCLPVDLVLHMRVHQGMRVSSWGREIHLFQGNLGWRHIVIWPDMMFCVDTVVYKSRKQIRPD